MILTIEIPDDVAVALKARAEAMSAAIYASRVTGTTVAPGVVPDNPVKPLETGYGCGPSADPHRPLKRLTRTGAKWSASSPGMFDDRGVAV